MSGASWDATDTLVPSVESFIRNIMLGQEFYRKELGVETVSYTHLELSVNVLLPVMRRSCFSGVLLTR